MKKSHSSKRNSSRLLLHRTHTGKLVPAGHTSYPLLAFILLLLGVLLVNLTMQVKAADIVVSGRVAGVPPSQAAVITSPANGTVFRSIPVPVKGTCPAGNIVKLYRNDVFSGSAMCDAQNSFMISTDLFPGANKLIARVFNLGDTEGPQSSPVKVYYNPPKPVQAGGKTWPRPRSPSRPIHKAIVLKTDTFYRGYYAGDKVLWKLGIEGGYPPYAISVDWGDKDSSVLSRQKPGLFEANHIYKKAGGYQGSYIIRVKASDLREGQASLQLVVIVNDPYLINGGASTGSPTLSAFGSIMRLVWSAYGVALLITFSFWLGMLRGEAVLNRRLKTHKIRPRHA